MTILLISSFYYPSFVGGAEVSVQMLAEGLLNAGNRVFVLVTGPADSIYRVNGVVIISLKQRNIFAAVGANHKPRVLKVLWHLIDSCNVLYYFTIRKLLRRIRPDIVHTNTIQGFSPLVWVAVKNYHTPLIHTTRDYYLFCHKCSLYNAGNCKMLCFPCKVTYSFKKRFVALPDHFVGISHFILDKHKPIFKDNQKTSVIYNGVHLTNETGTVRQTDKAICLGYIGRIAEDKGVTYFAEELARLKMRHQSKIKVLFAGKGDPAFITNLQNKLGEVDHVFLNIIKPEDFYPQIDILVVPALWNEPFGRTVIESLSYSVPVCQADIGGLTELYNPATSWMFTPGPGNLTALIEQIVDHDEQIMVKKRYCRKQAEKFSASICTQKHLELYQQLQPTRLQLISSGNPPVLQKAPGDSTFNLY